MDPNPMSTRTVPYYEDEGLGCDDVTRCASCRKLVTAKTLAALGMCPCGSTKVNEVRTLSLWEWFKIKTGLLRFKNSDKMLAEFGPKWGSRG